MTPFVEALVVVLCLHRAPSSAATCAADARRHAELVVETAGAYGLDPVRLAAVLLEARRAPLAPVTVDRLAHRLQRHRDLCDRSWRGALVSTHYRRGCRAPDTDRYVHRVRRWEHLLAQEMARRR